MLITSHVIKESGIGFGTSGARGLVTDFSTNACAAFTAAFVDVMKGNFDFTKVALAIDNRPSSPEIAKACAAMLVQYGIEVVYYGVVPTPALAATAMADNMPSIMVTGSHIPFDRNGLKFYRPDGEIDKQDEALILGNKASFEAITALDELRISPVAAEQYIERYTSLFNADVLAGKKVGIYEHSSAGRDLYADIFTKLGASVTALERSDVFVPIDTEAVSDEDALKALNWSKQYQFDFIFSTDGDGDRPLVADENGNWLRGDILGLLCAQLLNIEALAIPVSCNTAVEKSASFKQVTRTKIGSPYVIAEFSELNSKFASVAGFEANGGFLLGSDITINHNRLTALPTRDAVLPAIVLLASAKQVGVSQLVADLPQRFTASDRIKEFETQRSLSIIAEGTKDPKALLSKLGYEDVSVSDVDVTDGLRLTLNNNDVIHLRPSGNAPELRCYAESETEKQARSYVQQVLTKIQLI
ncbi:phosphomannomutase [uncultured Psychromonas sp.]|uniref:phosphomannomutase n=1 Tax=uncultured Psychromonas sp. TaxID=173974 RepID=UPI00261E1CD0|nr:phosphomannomutase [uncultured Psychromonas sp.]